MSVVQRDVLADVAQERARQDHLWGTQDHDDGVWSLILTEEVGEASEQALRLMFPPMSDEAWEGYGRLGTMTRLRTELIQVAAVAVAWVEALDRRPS